MPDLDSILADHTVYLDSDDDTRRQLKAQICRFAAHHRLTVEQAAHLWKGNQLRPAEGRLGCKAVMTASLVFALTTSGLLFFLFGQSSPFIALIVATVLFCPIWEFFSLILEGAVRRLFPTARSPVLHKEKVPPICAMLVASVQTDPNQTMKKLEALISANRHCHGLFGLILILPDAPVQQTAQDRALLVPFLIAFGNLEKRIDRPIRLVVCRRSYLPREKRWTGMPAKGRLLAACRSLIVGEEAPFELTVGQKKLEGLPEALYIAPADMSLSPDGLRHLAAALFHPLCETDCMLPILRSTDRSLCREVDGYTKRQITLQKTGGKLPFPGYGMIRLSSLTRELPNKGTHSLSLSCALASTDLYTCRLPESDSSRQAEALFLSVFPSLRSRIGALLRLPLYLALLNCPPLLCLFGILLSNADHLAELISAFRIGLRFSTHTLPTAFRLFKNVPGRILFAVSDCLDALPLPNQLGKYRKRLGALLSIGVGITAALIYDTPQAIVGLLWAFSPLFNFPTTKNSRKSLSASERRALGVLCKKCWLIFERTVTDAHPLPLICLDSGSDPLSDTSPDAFAFYLVACLSACEMGLIDRHTLEHRLCRALDAWEKLPLYHGLPYDRYSLRTGDCSSGGRIDTAACGRYALSLALLSASLFEYAVDQPSLLPLAERSTLLWQNADYQMLYDSEHSVFYEAITASGHSIGRLDQLASPAECVCIVAIALGQLDPIAWKRLHRPILSDRAVGYSSEKALDACLVPALFLESNEGSLLYCLQRAVCLSALKKNQPLSPQKAALMLPFFPVPALQKLHSLKDNGKPSDLPIDAIGLGQMMAATINTLFDRRLCRRLTRLPALSSLIPLLNEPCDRLEPSRPLDSPRNDLSSDAFEAIDPSPSIFLLGDSDWGLLWAEGKRIRIFYDRKTMNYPSSLHHLFNDGRFSGILLFFDGQPIDLPLYVRDHNDHAITLSFHSERYALHATLSLPEKGLLDLTLSGERIRSHLSAIFCFCPLCSAETPFWLETLEGNILLIQTDGFYAAISAQGLDKLFIRAEDAPFPLGEQALSSLLERTGSFTEGGLLSPACRIGGKVEGSVNCRFRLAFGKTRQSVLEKIKRVASASISPSPSPLPLDEESALARALSLELKWLLEEGMLKKMHPSDSSDHFSPHLQQCLDSALERLQKRGFETAPEPHLLTNRRGLPADELLRECLSKTKDPAVPALSSPPLPDRTRIRLTDTALTVKKGKDFPPVCRLYANDFCTFFADSFQPSFCFWKKKEPIPICLTVTDTACCAHTSAISLFYASSEVCYERSAVRYIGDGYSVCAHLSDTFPLLMLEVSAPLSADIRLSLNDASAATEDCLFWHRENGMVDFCARTVKKGRTVFLLGSFERASDRLYYQMREDVNERLANGLPLSEYAPFSAEVTWQSKPPYPAPLLIHPALAARIPEAFPLLLFFEAPYAQRSLVRVIEKSNPLSTVSACLLWAGATENTDFLREKITYSCQSGEVCESIYLASARALDKLIEASPQHPLLERFLNAFADLAHRMGDRSGEAVYREQLANISAVRAFHRTPDSIEALAQRLLSGDPKGVFEWKRRLDNLALFPSPEEGCTLWALFWYGILGYRQTPNAFTLSPIGAAFLDGSAFTLRKKGTLYRIRITLSQTAGCLLDGKESQALFLFDKKEHFLEIKVEKSARMV